MKHLKIFIGFCSLILLVFNLNEPHAAKRTALVIGNSSYKSSPLDNPVNDASDIAKALKRLGFDVILKKNATQRGMEDAMRKFGRKLARSQIGLFYYAGHGMQMQGINYLIPVKNNIKEESEVKYKAVNAGFVLARMDAPDGTIIAYATKAGSVAEDGKGRNGTYTGALLNNIANPNLDIRDMFNRVGLEVKRKTSGNQIPWTSNDPFPDYYLAGSTATVVSPSNTAIGILEINSNPTGADFFNVMWFSQFFLSIRIF